MTTRVRFAPSPTGYLHIGSARTALYNYLYARKTGGRFLLRIEDTDIARSTDESTRSILEGLAWLGLTHDEDIVFQSDNADKHRETARRLLAEGKAYRDFTPKEEVADRTVKEAIVERARQTEKNHRANPYRQLSSVESDTRAANGEPYAIRLKVAETGKTAFEDQVYGQQERDYSDTEDLVLLRSDGHPLYNLAVVCDDIEMGITHVIRGQDHLTNTHKQILIYEALGVTPPSFAHLPLILAPNKGKLSKRKHGEVVSLTTYRDNGFVPAAFTNFLALLGWSPGSGEEREIYSLDELVAKFSLDHIHRSNAVFNFQENDPRHWTDDKALWMNAEYIRTMPLDELLPLVKPELKAAKLWREEYESIADLRVGNSDLHGIEGSASAQIPNPNSDIPNRAWFEKTVDIIRHRFFTLKDFSSQGRAYFSEDYDFDPAAVAKNLTKFPDLKTWLPELADRFEAMEDPFDEAHVETAVKAFTEEKGTKLGVIMNGARTLLTGVAVGPSMLSVFEIIGRERTLMRLRSQVAWSQT
ncbi:MAG TPA: glutamate--tRNA ligase [Pyrinomonadaceae bacterium]|nr:glutamate--tRNA ligase [Pyrinomonadaceae bacterium]